MRPSVVIKLVLLLRATCDRDVNGAVDYVFQNNISLSSGGGSGGAAASSSNFN